MKRYLAMGLLLAALPSVAQQTRHYWQQHVDTRLQVTLDDKHHILHGHADITYTNNSPDTLRYIYMHLWPNAYKNDHTPYARQQDGNHSSTFYYSDKKDRGYMDSLDLVLDHEVHVDASSSADAPDIVRIDLPHPLLPGKKLRIETPFKMKLPVVFSRNGHTGQAYYVSQWFPKPAVYDHKGWHPISYLDQGEFYSEFGSYEVSITLPKNYVLMATGNCMTPAENKRMDSLAALPLPPATLYKDDFPASDAEMKTVVYKEDNIHDFAWFADKRFIVRKDTVYSPGTNKLITTWSAYMPSYQDKWKDANKHLADAVLHYGKWIGPYPYNTIKAVLGDMKSGGGMEYPTITLIDRVASAKLSTVIIHEAGHNWFYGMLGSNEREHAWMDEGLNTFYEQKTTKVMSKDSAARKRKNALDESLIYYQFAATNDDQPINTHSEQYRSLNYGIDVYYKTAEALRWLEQYMGPAEFEAAMKDYFETWRYRHPYPEDLRAIFEKHTSKPLDWFFDGMLNTDRKIDFKITRARVKNGNTIVTVKNRSDIKLPVAVAAYKGDSLTAMEWASPFSYKTIFLLHGSTWDKLVIADETPDAKTANDAYRRRALLRKFAPTVKPVLGLNRTYSEKLFVAPALGSNAHDGFMAGLLLHNLTVPENRFAFALAPMYAFGAGSWTAAGSLGYTFYPRSTFKDITLMADAKSFHNDKTDLNLNEPVYTRYIKVAPSLQFTFREKDPRSTVTRTLMLKGYSINEEMLGVGVDSTVPLIVTNVNNIYGKVRYRHQNDRTYNPFNYTFDGHGNGDFVKLNVEGNIRINYNVKNKSLYVRGYLGKFIAMNNDPAITNRYILNASYSGVNDYLYDGTYRGRNRTDGFWGQQVNAFGEGGFKVPIYNGAYRSDNWMAAVNLKTDLPKIKLPIRLFFDAGLMPNPSPGFKNIKSTMMMYDGGIELSLSQDVVSFYFPLIMSKDFRDRLADTYGSKNVFARSISFTLHLENINWLRFPSKILKTAGG
ncbi:hypothetical protein GCM10023093_01520 [Nemorincola caseinilytica]|uniref:Peptidase M1 membrane alanine aminopeptidase domain-containing protein n=1 Tax=Nemorincola caseinilytica TaxID=2054315 RepID=A0ABP8N5V2_9BACT